MSDEPEVDIRGEPCGMPVLRVEKFLKDKSGGRPFVVLGDHPQTIEALQILALRHGWTCEVAQPDPRTWRARFTPPKPPA